VAEYLRQRLDLPVAEPTPDEVAAHLRRAGLDAKLASEAAAFFRACDAGRFAAGAAGAADLQSAASRFVLAVEEAGNNASRFVDAMAPLVLLPAWLGAAAAPPEFAALREAEIAFHEGLYAADHEPDAARQAFRKSAGLFAEFRRAGHRNAAVYRNEGNAWLLAGELPRAILAYRLGLELAPNDRTLQAGLAFARKQVAYPSPASLGRPTIDHVLPRPVPGWHLGLTVIAYAGGWVALTRWRMTRRGRLAWLAGAAWMTAALLATGLVYTDWQSRVQARHPVVVVAEDGVLLYRGNGEMYSHHEPPLTRGVEARRLFARGDWLQIELAGGETGWVRRDLVVGGDSQGVAGSWIEEERRAVRPGPTEGAGGRRPPAARGGAEGLRWAR
jgi:hypothetical protein